MTLTKERIEQLAPDQASLGAPGDLAIGDLYERMEIFLRMYSPQSRPYIAFHSDVSSYTVNIALNEDSRFEGGRLLALSGDGLTVPSRALGTAILHSGNLVHGVSKIESGTRYSLILFFYRRALAVPEPSESVTLQAAE